MSIKDELMAYYGPRMNVTELCVVTRLSRGTIYNKIHKKTLGIDTYKIGGTIYADTVDVANYLEEQKIIGV